MYNNAIQIPRVPVQIVDDQDTAMRGGGEKEERGAVCHEQLELSGERSNFQHQIMTEG